jgi:hypothetical protein
MTTSTNPIPTRTKVFPWLRDWAGILTLVMAIHLLLQVLWLIFGWSGPVYETLFGFVAWPLILLPLVALSWRAAAHPALDRQTRRAWVLLGFAFFDALLAAVIAIALSLYYAPEQPPSPSLADILNLLLYPLLLWGLLSFPAAPVAQPNGLHSGWM